VRHLLRAIERAGGRRNHLAQPIGRQIEKRRIRDLGHAFSAPAGQVWDHDLTHDVQLGLDQGEPATGTAFAFEPERSTEPDHESGGRNRVRSRGARRRVELVVDDLRDEVLGHGEQILVGRGLLARERRAPKHAPIPGPDKRLDVARACACIARSRTALRVRRPLSGA